MTLPFPIGGTTNTIVSSVYGTNASNAILYSQAPVSITNLIESAKWSSIRSQINQERVRRTAAAAGFSISGSVAALDFTSMINALNVAGPASSQAYNSSGTVTVTTFGQTGAPTLPSAPTAGSNTITASEMNALINALNNAGSQCTCNCNYCTCNCNYCTCNCNFICPCNCNYSDRRLKMNIEFIGIKNGLKIYSFNYVWNKTKMIGVMAQDLLKTKFESALSKDKNGFYMVNYNKLPAIM